jgi:ABC-type polysaccharide/polyol phosphate export permease
MLQTLESARSDIRAAFKLRHVWIALASEDIGDQHRRTALGPFWLLINYLAFAGTFVLLFHHGGEGAANYPAYVAIGLLVWFYIMETITLSVSLFVREESFIKGTTLPLSVYVMRLAMQGVIRSGYALAGCLAILLMSGVPPTAAWGWSALGLAVLLAATPAAIIVCAFFGAYFPDSQFIVANLMRIGMFLTPVFWVHAAGTGGAQGAFYYWNPFTYFLEIVRIPILSGELPANALALCVAMSAVLWLIALILLGRYRREIVFVL